MLLAPIQFFLSASYKLIHICTVRGRNFHILVISVIKVFLQSKFHRINFVMLCPKIPAETELIKWTPGRRRRLEKLRRAEDPARAGRLLPETGARHASARSGQQAWTRFVKLNSGPELAKSYLSWLICKKSKKNVMILKIFSQKIGAK
jgi:hypothetical protein